VASLEPDLDWLGALSAFRYFRPAAVIDGGAIPLGELGLFAAVAIGCWAAAVWRFRTRDLVA
jgi:hypothetical protein